MLFNIFLGIFIKNLSALKIVSQYLIRSILCVDETMYNSMEKKNTIEIEEMIKQLFIKVKVLKLF